MGNRIQRSQDVPTFRHPMSDGSGDWVDMKTSFRLGDRDAINAHMVRAVVKVNPETGEEEMTGKVELDTSLANVATLKQAITAWGGDGFTTNGKVDDVTLENIAGLEEDDSKELLAALNARNPRAIGPKGKAKQATPAGNTSAS